MCKYEAGKVLLKSITLNISDCVGCSEEDEGVYLTLLGEKVDIEGDYINLLGHPIDTLRQGIPCNTSKLDNPLTKDFGFNTTTVFDGNPDENAKKMLGKCYEVSLGFIEHIALIYYCFQPVSTECTADE